MTIVKDSVKTYDKKCKLKIINIIETSILYHLTNRYKRLSYKSAKRISIWLSLKIHLATTDSNIIKAKILEDLVYALKKESIRISDNEVFQLEDLINELTLEYSFLEKILKKNEKESSLNYSSLFSNSFNTLKNIFNTVLKSFNLKFC